MIKSLSLVLLTLSLFLFQSGCGVKIEDTNSTQVTGSYTFLNTRLVPSSSNLYVKVYEDSDVRYSKTLSYIQSDDINITFDKTTNKRVVFNQDSENNQSLSVYDDRRLIFLSVGNDDEGNYDVPVNILGPTQDELESNYPVIKVYNAVVMSDGEKLVVVQQNQNIDNTKLMGYKEQTLGWYKIDSGNNLLYEIYRFDKNGNRIGGAQNTGQETFTLERNHAYLMVLYEDSANVDVPYIKLVEVTP